MDIRHVIDLIFLLTGLILILNEITMGSPNYAIFAVGGFLMGMPALVRPPRYTSETCPGKDIQSKLVESKPVKITRNTDLRIAQPIPEHPFEREIRQDMERLKLPA